MNKTAETNEPIVATQDSGTTVNVSNPINDFISFDPNEQMVSTHDSGASSNFIQNYCEGLYGYAHHQTVLASLTADKNILQHRYEQQLTILEDVEKNGTEVDVLEAEQALHESEMKYLCAENAVEEYFGKYIFTYELAAVQHQINEEKNEKQNL